jgi:hypothetical protein
MGQCCTNRSKPTNSDVQSVEGIERFGVTNKGTFSSGKVPTIRLLAACPLNGKRTPYNLFLGNWRSGRNKNALRMHSIGARLEVCMRNDFPEGKKIKAVEDGTYRLLLSEVQPKSIVSIIDECVMFVASHVKRRNHVLIHSRSSNHTTEVWSIAIACGCLMKMHRWPMEHALYIIKSQSPDLELPYAIGTRLQTYERHLGYAEGSPYRSSGFNEEDHELPRAPPRRRRLSSNTNRLIDDRNNIEHNLRQRESRQYAAMGNYYTGEQSEHKWPQTSPRSSRQNISEPTYEFSRSIKEKPATQPQSKMRDV